MSSLKGDHKNLQRENEGCTTYLWESSHSRICMVQNIVGGAGVTSQVPRGNLTKVSPMRDGQTREDSIAQSMDTEDSISEFPLIDSKIKK